MEKKQTFLNLIGLSSGADDSQEGLDGMSFEVLCARVQEFRDEIDALQKANEALEKENGKAKKKIERLEFDKKSMRHANDKLLQQIKEDEKESEEAEKANESLDSQLQALKAEKEHYRKVVARLNSQINDLKHDNYRFRQMIVPVSEKQVLDSDVGQKFISLRSSILGLVRQTWRTAIKSNIDLEGLSGYQGDFFRSPLPLSYDRIRSTVFKIIHDSVLGSQCYFLGDGFEQLEQDIRIVEKGLNRNSSESEYKTHLNQILLSGYLC